MAEIRKIRVDGTDYDVRDTSKVAVQQGTANAGRIMQVGADGNLTPTAALDDKVNKTQTVNGKTLSGNITLDANDIPYDDDPEAEIIVGSVGSALFQRPQYNQVVRVDGEQSLTDAQKATARDNIDAASVGEVSDIKSQTNFYLYTSNLPFYSHELTVKGTGAYANNDFLIITDFSVGDKFDVVYDNVVGSQAARPFVIYVLAGTTIVTSTPLNSITITQAYIDSGVDSIKFRFYPTQGTSLPTGIATATNLRVVKNGEDYISLSSPLNKKISEKISSAISDFNNDLKDKTNFYLFKSNLPFYSNEVVVNGTEEYAKNDFLTISVFSAGDKFDVVYDNVVGSQAARPFVIYVYAGNTLITSTNLNSTTITQDYINSGADHIVFRFYPTQGTSLPTGRATATNVRVVKNNEDYISLSEPLNNEIDEKITHSSAPVISSLVNGGLLDADIKYSNQLFKINATTNNESGNTTYIFKDIYVTVADDEVLSLYCENVENNVTDQCIWIYFLDSDNNVVWGSAYTLERIQSGVRLIPTPTTARVRVRLYASTSGGLTDTYCIYHNLIIWTSKDGYLRTIGDAVDSEIVPAYYFKGGYIQDKINTILSAQEAASGNFDCFIFCTDQHWTQNAKNSPRLIKYISSYLTIPRIFMGGDYDDGIDLNCYKAYKDDYRGNIYNVIGNHEYMDVYTKLDGERIIRTITGSTIWASLNSGYSDVIIGDTTHNYYYVDNAVVKMRYIVLNVFKDNSDGDFNSTEAAWLQNVALDLPSGYTAVIFAHRIASVDVDTGDLTIWPAEQEIADIADAYSGNGEIACLIAGHTHRDGLGTTTGGIPIFITTCDKYKPWIQDGVDMEPWITADRHLGTITEQAFDVVVINKTSKLISFIRIGAPADNGSSDKLEIRTANYGNYGS